VTDTTWTVKAALDWTRAYLAEKGDLQPRLSAEWLLSAATGLSRVELYAFHDRPLTPEERTSLRESVRRRAAGEPLQYISGEMAFRHVIVKVKPGVLIPRPETEVLVDAVLPAIERAIAGRGEALVVDLCTGSGCVALSIAQECEHTRVWATDVSPLAVDVALANSLRLALAERLHVLEGDLFAPIEGAAPELRGHVDVVVANPPYIPSADLPTLPAEVLGYEPGLALDGGPDGLDVARRIWDEAREWLCPGGAIALELDTNRVRHAEVEVLQWYSDVQVVRDLTGRDRFLVARVPNSRGGSA
jgi:release factor glutamine methyltransferase